MPSVLTRIRKTALVAAALAGGLAAGCAPARDATAAPSPTGSAAAGPERSSPLPPAPTSAAPPASAQKAPPDDPAARGEAMRTEIDSLDAEVQRGLVLLTDALADARTERKAWTGIDRSVAAARVVNKALGERCRAVIKIYDTHAASALARFEKRLKEAPPVFRALAGVRKAQADAATLEYERRNYQAMAELCEAAAVLCERRHDELFGAAPAETDSPGQPQRANATTLAATVANMRKLLLVHDRWEETFAAYPSSLDEGKLAALFDHLSAYAEDLEEFTSGVESLKETMKRRATGPSPQPLPKPAEPLPGGKKPDAKQPSTAPSVPQAGEPKPLSPPAPTTRRLTEAEVRQRVDALVRKRLAEQQTSRPRVNGVYTVRTTTLPVRLDPNTVYVVSGPPPAGACPSNVVYDTVVSDARNP